MRIAGLAAIVVCAALFAAGCGGGGSAGSSSTAPREGGGGTSKQATAPNAPAGSKVINCKAGGGQVEGLRATAVDCGTARETMRRWGQNDSCALAEGASRGSCSLGDFRCQSVKADRGVAVSCAHPGGDVAFISTKE
jgi:hypothetical protein